jgi:hypothetical protein
MDRRAAADTLHVSLCETVDAPHLSLISSLWPSPRAATSTSERPGLTLVIAHSEREIAPEVAAPKSWHWLYGLDQGCVTQGDGY